MTDQDREKKILRNVANAAKLVKRQWASTMDYPIPKTEPLQKLFSAVSELEDFEKEAFGRER